MTLLILSSLTLGVVSPAQSEQRTQQIIQTSSAFVDIQDSTHLATIDLAQMQDRVENAIGLTAATVTVKLVQPETGVSPIPWRSNSRPHIQIAIPKSWILKRASQIGEDATPLHAIENIIQQTVPGAAFSIEIVESPLIAKTTEPSQEVYAKQLVLMIGLCLMLTSGFIVNRRKVEFEKVEIPQLLSVEAEAKAILSMDFSMAKQTIDAIDGSRKFAVLQAIVSSVDQQESNPIVQVPAQQTLVGSHSN